jgi:hypothetical protein
MEHLLSGTFDLQVTNESYPVKFSQNTDLTIETKFPVSLAKAARPTKGYHSRNYQIGYYILHVPRKWSLESDGTHVLHGGLQVTTELILDPEHRLGLRLPLIPYPLVSKGIF